MNSGSETEKNDKKRSQSSQEINRTKEVKLLQKEDENDKTQGSFDTFIPQDMKEPPRSSQQGSTEEGSRSSKELDVTEGTDLQRSWT